MRAPNSNPLKAAFSAAITTFAALEGPRVTQMRGTLGKRCLLIAPAPNEEECSRNLPLSDDGYAQELHSMMSGLADLDTQEDFLVMCGTPMAGKKATKKSVEPFREMLLTHRTQFDLVVCIGAENFKFYFGRGKKSGMQTLASGTPVFMTFDWPKLPIFVLPDLHMLSPKFTGDRNLDWKLERGQESCQQWIERLLPPLKQSYERYVK